MTGSHDEHKSLILRFTVRQSLGKHTGRSEKPPSPDRRAACDPNGAANKTLMAPPPPASTRVTFGAAVRGCRVVGWACGWLGGSVGRLAGPVE